jgi:hypothetical protein
MSRKKNRNHRQDIQKQTKLDLHPEAKKTIGGIVMLLLAVILLLSYFNSAGVVGHYIYQVLDYLIGVGFLIFVLQIGRAHV